MSDNLPTPAQCASIRKRLAVCLELAAGIHFLDGIVVPDADTTMRAFLVENLGEIAKQLGLELVERHPAPTAHEAAIADFIKTEIEKEPN